MHFTTSTAVLVLFVGVFTVLLGAYMKKEEPASSHAILLLGLFIGFVGSVLLALSLYQKNRKER